MRRIRRLAVGGFAALAVAGGTLIAGAGTAQADTQLCDQYGSTSIAGGRYVVQNDEWNSTSTQCLTVTATGFTVSTADQNVPPNGPPAGYPSIYAGCHYGNCSTGSGLPTQVSSAGFGSVATSVDFSTPDAGAWDAAYDIWLDPTPRTDGQNTGAEIMVWGSHRGDPQPVGSKIGTATIAGATWDVWEGNIGWNVISYVRQQTTTSLSFGLTEFTGDAISRGYAQSDWYLTSVQFGFEPWQGGQGLAVNDFSYPTG